MNASAPTSLPGRRRWMALAFLLLPVVATGDYLTGFEFQFSIFYLVPICLTTWFGGWQMGVMVSLMSVLFSLAGDLASGAVYKNEFIHWWNLLIVQSFYLAIITALFRLRQFQFQLGERVHKRTLELREEIQERKKLERALLEVSEREQRRIGHDLHDSLCQHLTSASLAGQVLTEKLRSKAVDEASDSDRLVVLIEDGIDLARSLARGLSPVELDELGLTAALRELLRSTQQRTRIQCSLEMTEDLALPSSEAIVHLFRIAQEAVSNAVRHSKAGHLSIHMHNTPSGVEMRIMDDGTGLPPTGTRKSGMGLHIMRHRASMIGASFDIQSSTQGTAIRITMT